MSDADKATVQRRRRLLQRRRQPQIAIVAAAVGTIAAGQWLGRTAGSTRAERRQPLPGDELVDHPSVVTNHATTIPVPPERVWPWLVQMGWHRGGWYTPRWVDRLGAAIDWSWTFTLADTAGSGTRLLLRVRGRTRPWWLTVTYLWVLVPADYVMASSMLAGIRRRAAPTGRHQGPERIPREGGRQPA